MNRQELGDEENAEYIQVPSNSPTDPSDMQPKRSGEEKGSASTDEGPGEDRESNKKSSEKQAQGVAREINAPITQNFGRK